MIYKKMLTTKMIFTENESSDITIYLLYETMDYKKEQYVNVIGTFIRKEDAIVKMNEHSKKKGYGDDPSFVLKNPDDYYNFQYISIQNNDKLTDKSNLYFFLPIDKYPYIDNKNIFSNNPWVVEDFFSRYENEKEGYMLINELFNTNFKSNKFEYKEENFGIKSDREGNFKIYFRSMVKDKEYVKGILRKIYSVIDSKNSYVNPEKEIKKDNSNLFSSYENDDDYSILGAWLNSIEFEDFRDSISFEDYGYGDNQSTCANFYVIEPVTLK